jgi:Tol biopolymer transport system component
VKKLAAFASVLGLCGLLGFSGAATGGATASAAGGTATAEGDWILLSSNRDGKDRVYSVGTNGEPLTPLFAPGPPRLVPVAVSRNGAAIAYTAGKEAPDFGPLYVSRANGMGLRRVGQTTSGIQEFSPNGKLLAFLGKRGIWIVGSDGHGLRRLTNRDDQAFGWSPDGKALVLLRVIKANVYGGGRYAVVVQPLRGKRRVVVRTGPHEDDVTSEYQPQWSPNGRWIAYIDHEDNERKKGLTLVRPNGKGRHRAVLGANDGDTFKWSPDGRWMAYMTEAPPDLLYIRPSGAWHKISNDAISPVVWSPDGKKLAFSESKAVAVARADGRGLRRLHLSAGSELTWLPDARHIAFAGGYRQIWVVGSDGKGLRRLTNEGANDLVGSTRLPPVLPPAPPNPPTERVLDASTVATSTPVEALSADGSGVAFVPRPTVTDCFHVVVWSPGGGLERLGNLPAPCHGATTTGVAPLVLAGTRAAWIWSGTEDDACVFSLETATLADPVPHFVTGGTRACKPDAAHLRGDGDLLVFNDESHRSPWLVRLGVGSRRCGGLPCATLRTGAQAAPVDAASGALIAVKRLGTVTVLNDQGTIVRTFPFSPADVSAARLDGGHLVVARSYTIESYDVATGTLEGSQPLPAGYQLADVDGGIAVLRRPRAVIVLRLDNGASLTLAPGQPPMFADLETPGLYYSYATGDGGGRVVFLARAELLQQLSGP